MASESSFHSNYTSSNEILGEGMSGLVRVYQNNLTNLAVAVKTLNLENISTSRRSMLLSEVDIYRRLSHPNIVNLLEVYSEESRIFLVMEICRGGELYDRLAARSFFDEATAICLTRQMLSAVAYLHSKHIVHRDLKLEHWLFKLLSFDPLTHDPTHGHPSHPSHLSHHMTSEQPSEHATHGQLSEHHATHGMTIALCDFGMGAHVSPGTPLTTTLGSIHYVAPEVLSGRYSLECDAWSLGVIVYMLLSGSAPFDGGSDEEVMTKVRQGHYAPMTGTRWDAVSDTGQDFVKQLLTVDVSKRMTAQQGLIHPWLTQPGDVVRDGDKGLSSLRQGRERGITRVHSVPSKSTEIYFPPGWYRVLRGFYGRQAVSNLVLGLVHGWSGFARKAKALGLTRVLRLGQGALFLLPNPKFHDELGNFREEMDRRGARFVVWWVAEEFEEALMRWHDEGGDSPREEAGLGDPGDFGFSGERKTEGYLHCYRDLRGERGVAVLKGLKEISDSFLFILCQQRHHRQVGQRDVDDGGEDSKRYEISRGFHFPVRTQYSTLHMQIRVNSGSVVGSDGRGVALEQVMNRLEEDPEIYWRDEEAMRFRVTENIKANLMAAAAGATDARDVGNTTEGE